jgi:hypothetical protein
MPKRLAESSPSSAGSAAGTSPHQPNGAITNVTLGTGSRLCAFCDTPIPKGWPCIERTTLQAGAVHRRENTRANGGCSAGSETVHAQCAFRLDTAPHAKGATCCGCGVATERGRRVVSHVAGASGRCSEGSPLRWCFECARRFVARHRSILDGHLGAAQMEEGVAWVRHRPLYPPVGLQAGCGLPPMTASARRPFLEIFRSQSAETEALAVERHRQLQASIVQAMREDETLARARSVHALRPPTPFERKAKRMRLASPAANALQLE